MSDDQQIEYHHIHPVATLTGRDKRDVNDIANLAFISQKANRKISDKPPSVYFEYLEDAELEAHYVPLDIDLRSTDAFPRFLVARRRLLAEAMTALLEKFRPRWLDRMPAGPAAATDSYKLTMVLYGSAWAPGRLVFKANGPDIRWTGTTDMADLTQAITAAANGIDSDIEIAGESVPVQAVEGTLAIAIGPFQVTGTADEWKSVLAREQATMLPLHSLPSFLEKPWQREHTPIPVTNTD